MRQCGNAWRSGASKGAGWCWVPATGRALTCRRAPTCSPQIKHIVVLMMENHSYDNYLGTLAGRGDGLPVDASGTPPR